MIETPVRSPRANAYAERWVRTVRTECLDWLLILGHGHLERVLRQYVCHYNRQRPHRGIDLAVPAGEVGCTPPTLHRVDRHDVLGGLIHEYCPVAAQPQRRHRIGLRGTAASSPRQNPVGRMDRVTDPKLPFDIPKGEQSFAPGKGRFCARVRPQSQRGSGEKGFLAGTGRRDRGLGALQGWSRQEPRGPVVDYLNVGLRDYANVDIPN